MTEPTCEAIAASCHEPLYATASIVRSWLLVEQPGPWGRDAVRESRLPAMVAAGLEALSLEYDFRVLLLRRVRSTSSADGRRCFVVHCQRGREWIEEALVPEAEALLEVDFASLADGVPPRFGAQREHPLYLVCTNGRHDPCCARLGRPIARTLKSDGPGSVWECSHIGGDRFAGNLVCLPDGCYFGRLGERDAARVVDRYQQGLVELDHYRGRAGDPYVVQAADYFVRRETGLLGIGDVVPLGRQALRPGVVRVDLQAPGRRYEVVVGLARAKDARPLTCTAAAPARPAVYTLLGLQAL